MAELAVLRKSYQRDAVVDQEHLYHIWMPDRIQLDIRNWFLGWGRGEVAGNGAIFSSDLTCWLKVLAINESKT